MNTLFFETAERREGREMKREDKKKKIGEKSRRRVEIMVIGREEREQKRSEKERDQV